VQLTSRIATEARTYKGETVGAGQTVITMTGAANRDPEAFEDPDRLDLGRQSANPHLAFGRGIHFCLGAPLARIEGQIAFNMLAKRFPKIDLAAAPEWKPTVVLRGPAKLSVTLPR
jgi:cytochrome P450